MYMYSDFYRVHVCTVLYMYVDLDYHAGIIGVGEMGWNYRYQ